MKYFCNPINLEYRYQFFKGTDETGVCEVHREAADPSLIYFRGKYYLFPSMTGGFYVSETLEDWVFYDFLNKMPDYDYAPDVSVVGDFIYFCASRSGERCSFYRTKDPVTEPFEEIEGSFSFWDPDLFEDDDGRLYLYWGCSNIEPIYGVELDPETMKPTGSKRALIYAHEDSHGFERTGEDHQPPKSEQEIEQTVRQILEQAPTGQEPDETMIQQLYGWFGNNPYIEGAWVTKYKGRYYLQYAVPGTEYNVYCDGVYVSDAPLGPFTPARNNPFSYKPGGFITGAGHGSTMMDRHGDYWHTSTMRISRNHKFERRIGLWKAGFDQDGELFCDQRYGDWPIRCEGKPFDTPDWMLLSYGKPVKSSTGSGREYITDENIRTWWTSGADETDIWVEIDLEKCMDVRAVQINFADDFKVLPKPEMEFYYDQQTYRAIDKERHTTRWILEGSLDGQDYFVLKDKSEADTDLSHDFVLWEDGVKLRYLKLASIQLPYNQPPCISGIRVFGKGYGELPQIVENMTVNLKNENPAESLDMDLSWEAAGAVGYNILWGYAPDKLYHSYMVYGKTDQKIGALVKNDPVFVRIDAFNENGITEGVTCKVRSREKSTESTGGACNG